MDTTTDYLRLNDQKLFKKVREVLPKDLLTTKNIIDVSSDVLFLWNIEDCNVLVLNIRSINTQDKDEINYQTLLPTQPISFPVDRLCVNGVMSLLAVSGPKGISVLELPRRGQHGNFDNGKEVVSCRNYMLDERFFTCSSFVSCLQVRWHPGSPRDNHLLALTSENTLRLYHIDDDHTKVQRIWTIGKKPRPNISSSMMPYLAALGETGVDFDFAPPELPKKKLSMNESNDDKKWQNLQWPVYILRGNGDVYILYAALNGLLLDKPRLCGPLVMHPAADDNYGCDACAIICIKSTPPVLAISTCTGTIYHCVTLNSEDIGDNETEWKQLEDSNLASKALYVFESIELELGLALSDNEESYSCPIFFHHDEANKSRYFCSHETGVHAITLPAISELEMFLNAEEDDLDICQPSFTNQSLAEYLICTHTTSSSKANPIIGLAIIHNPTSLIALLGSGQIVSMPLVSVLLPLVGNEENEKNAYCESPTKKILKQPFDEYIKSFLKPTLTQPILKLLPKDESNPQERFELLSRATQTFREEHFKKHEKVREEIEKRVKALQMLKEYQFKELRRLQDEKEQLQTHAEKLAERYEDIKEKQELLTRRSEMLLRLVNQRQPIQSNAEKELVKDLTQREEQMKYFKKMFEQVKKKQKYHQFQIQQWRSQQKKREMHLGTVQTNSIKSNLANMTQEISTIRKEIILHKQELGLN